MNIIINSCDVNSIISKLKEEEHSVVRSASNADIKDIIELWANFASIRQIFDSERWQWKKNSSLMWAEYITDIISDNYKIITLCDFQDNGLSGFLIGHIQKLPPYYEAAYTLNIDEFYIRPKERSPELLKQMIDFSVQQLYQNFGLDRHTKVNLKLETLDSEATILSEYFKKQPHTCSRVYRASL